MSTRLFALSAAPTEIGPGEGARREEREGTDLGGLARSLRDWRPSLPCFVEKPPSVQSVARLVGIQDATRERVCWTERSRSAWKATGS